MNSPKEMMPIDFCKPENAVGEPTIIESPSKRFTLTIQAYKTGERTITYGSGVQAVTKVVKTWNYTSGVLKDGEEVITTIYRNYSDFFHTFFLKNGTEWIVCGSSYTSQTFIDLETRMVFERPTDSKDGFCWTTVNANPSGSLLLVCGCVWGGPYEYIMYDFSDPSKGWPRLPMEHDDRSEAYIDDGFQDHQEIQFASDDECTIQQMYRFNETAQKWTEDMSDDDEEDDEDATSDGKNRVTLRVKYHYKLKLVNGKIVVQGNYNDDDQSVAINDPNIGVLVPTQPATCDQSLNKVEDRGEIILQRSEDLTTKPTTERDEDSSTEIGALLAKVQLNAQDHSTPIN